MTKTAFHKAIQAATIVSFLLLGGCATVKEGLVGQEYAYLLPFAEQTVSSLGIERIDFRESEFAYLRQIADTATPEIENLQRLLGMVDEFRDRIVYYSVEVVRIGETEGTDEERVQDYADALLDMQGMFSIQLDLEQPEIDRIIADVRSQESFLDALRAAQPFIDRASEQFESLLMEIEQQALPRVVNSLDAAIESHYAIFLDYNQVLIDRRDELLTGMTYLRQARQGDRVAVESLRGLSLVSMYAIEVPNDPGAAELDRIEQFFLAQLGRDDAVATYLAFDVDGYLNAHAELERESEEVIDGLTVARMQVVAWSRAHLAMANGAKEPGRWLKVALDAASAVKRAKSSL